MLTDRDLFHQIKRSAVEAGCMTRTPWRYGLLFVSILILFCGSYIGLLFADGLGRAVCILGAAYGLVQFAFLGHDAGHFEVSRRGWVNNWAGQIGMSIVAGLSFSYWRQQHNQHHKHSQDETLDPDMQSEAVALYAGALRARRGIGKWMARWQAPLLLWLYALHIFQIRYDGVVYILRHRSKTIVDALLLAVHLLLWLALPAYLLGAGAAVVNYLIISMLAGMTYGPVFVTNHVGAESFTPGDGVSYWRRQIVGSRNVTCWPIFDFHFGGLNYQIEHHLFPGMSRYHYRKLSPIVQRVCEREGLAYLQESFPRAIWSVLAHLHRLSVLFRASEAEAKKSRRSGASIAAAPVHLESSASTGRQPVGVLPDSRSAQRCI